MIDALIAWDSEDDPDGNVQHIADNDVTPEEVMDVLHNMNTRFGVSRSSGLPMAIGHTPTGRLIAVVWEVTTERPLVVYPVTAFKVE